MPSLTNKLGSNNKDKEPLFPKNDPIHEKDLLGNDTRKKWTKKYAPKWSVSGDLPLVGGFNPFEKY